MKLITFSREGITQRVGAILNDAVIDLHIAYKSLLVSEGKIRAQQIADAFVRNATFGNPIIIDNPLLTYSGVADFVYSKDAADACVGACFAKDLPSRVYNISWGRPHEFQELVDVTKMIFPEVEIKIKEIAKTGYANQPMNRFPYDISKARKEFGYEPHFHLESAFRDYAQWLRKYSKT